MSAFDREAEKLLGMPASQLAALRDSGDTVTFDAVFKQPLERDWMFGMKGTSKTGGDASQQVSPKHALSSHWRVPPADSPCLACSYVRRWIWLRASS